MLIICVHCQQEQPHPLAEVIHRFDRLERLIKHEGALIMTDIDTLTADFDAYKGDVATTLDGLKATVQALQDEIANSGTTVPAEVQAKLDALDADIAAADAALKPAPVEPPVDEPTA